MPRLGAAAPAVGGVTAVLVHASFQTPYGGALYLSLPLLLLALTLGFLGTVRYGFIQTFLLLEAAGLALNLVYTAVSASCGSLEGDTLVVLAVAVAAAETAVGLSLFLVLCAPHGESTTTPAGFRFTPKQSSPPPVGSPGVAAAGPFFSLSSYNAESARNMRELSDKFRVSDKVSETLGDLHGRGVITPHGERFEIGRAHV